MTLPGGRRPPCLVAATLEDLFAPVATTAPSPVGRLTCREILLLDLATGLILSWNLFVINLARTPERLWFWIPALAWLCLFAGHSTAYTLRTRTQRGTRTVADGRAS